MAIAERSLITNVIRSASQPLEGNARNLYGRLRRAQRWPIGARAMRTGRSVSGIHNLHGHGYRRFRVDGPAERKRVRPANSYEAAFHKAGTPNVLLPLRDNVSASIALRDPRLERAIGVIYLPQTERQSHYFDARLSDQFDAVIHFDETSALQPLERYALWESGEPPETFQFGV